MYSIKNKKASRIEFVTFAELNMLESDIEEILRNSIEMICDEEESMLIVGKQVRNKKGGRSDLTAIDSNGNIVLIEIKRDKSDIVNRSEAFEFQAIRYAASYATIKDIESLVEKVYAPYIEKYKDEFELGELTSHELGIRKLTEFLEENNASNSFNKMQRIILVSSEFDDQTLSAVTWLNSNNVDISCYKLNPYKLGDEIFFKIDKILPTPNHSEFYVDLMDSPVTHYTDKTKKRTNRVLPRIDNMLEWGVVKEGDIILPKGRDGRAELLANGYVNVEGKEMSLQAWLKDVYGWSSVETYALSVHQETGKTLSQLREEYMNKKKESHDEL
ncbi:MAG: hypothetical protein GX345_07625 [Clostridiales bacterium]|nr:hypothetical protein [Clostridiales bacterium]